MIAEDEQSSISMVATTRAKENSSNQNDFHKEDADTTGETEATPIGENGKGLNQSGEIVGIPENVRNSADRKEQRELNARRQSLRQHRMSLSGTSEALPTVEFVEPMEGTPAAEALKANAAIKVTMVTKGLKKLRGMKRPKLKSLNVVKKLKKTTKYKKKNHFSKNFKGKVIDGLHERYALTAGMMLGIRYSVSRVVHVDGTKDDLNISDFNFVEKVTFPPQGSNIPGCITPPHKLAHTYKFKSYAPNVFKRIREFFGIDPANYIQSVAGGYDFCEFISNSKSGMYFFYSHDGKYMIKTQTKEENKFMKRILPHYYKFLTENPHTMMVQILGMHRVKMYHLRRKIHFVIMHSVFDSPIQIHTIYDLKGSRIGRSATAEEREKGGVLKDNDIVSDGVKIHLGPKREPFLKQLERDAMFLASLNIMDYSLLLGVHDRKKRVPEVSEPSAAPTTDTPSRPASVTKSRSNTPFRQSVTALQLNAAVLHNTTGSDNSPPPPPPMNDSPGISSPRRNTLQNIVYNSSGPQTPPLSHKRAKSAKRGVNSTSGSSKTAKELFKDDCDKEAANKDQQSIPSCSKRVVFPDEKKDDESSENGQLAVAAVHEFFEDGDDEDNMDECEDEDDDEDEDEADDIDYGDSDVEEERRLNAVASNTAESGATLKIPLPLGADEPGSRLIAGEPVGEDTVGALGPEGYRLSKVFRSPEALEALQGHEHEQKKDKGLFGNLLYRLSMKVSKSDPKTTKKDSSGSHIGSDADHITAAASDAEIERTYGPGITFVHPWTSRADGGINSRGPDGRNDLIYFAGIIDILQEYNMHKYAETLLKGLTQDVSKISSVDSISYAKRFVQFIRDNSD